MKTIHSLILTTLVLLIYSCGKKETLHISLTDISTGTDINIYQIEFINNDTGFACGGIRDEAGYVFQTIDGGISWTSFSMPFPKCVYSIQVFNENEILAGADDTYIFYTSNGSDWNTQWHDSEELPFHENNRPAVKRIQFLNDTLGYFVGGENFNKGVIYKTIDAGNHWTFDTLFHELKGMHFVDENSGYVTGYGYVGKTIDGANSFTQIEIDRDFYMSIQPLADGSLITVSNTGDVLKSYNDGSSWERVLKGNKLFGRRVGYNDMVFDDATGYIVGNDGIILISSDYGETWKEIEYNGKENLNTVCIQNSLVFVAGENGKVLRFSLN